MIPFASIMNLKNVSVPKPQAQTHTYAHSPWRGDQVSPMAANMQRDVYRIGSRLIVKVLYNARETDFQAACINDVTQWAFRPEAPFETRMAPNRPDCFTCSAAH